MWKYQKYLLAAAGTFFGCLGYALVRGFYGDTTTWYDWAVLLMGLTFPLGVSFRAGEILEQEDAPMMRKLAAQGLRVHPSSAHHLKDSNTPQ